MNIAVPSIWILAHIASGISIGLAGSSTYLGMFLMSIQVVFLTTFCMSNKLLYCYLKAEMSLVVSVGACTMSLVVLILVGVAFPVGVILYLPMFFSAIIIQFAYGFYLHKKSLIQKPEQHPTLNLSEHDHDILSNYIKI